ncbi:hypothetical protein EDD17DRAFT_1508017 [Pisolithus thermaeus]|nr:hypothetical protein EDD17DRAFT_1508017 [Pisolithus thermaeus]
MELGFTTLSEVQMGHGPPKQCVWQTEKPSVVATSSEHDEGKKRHSQSHQWNNEISVSQVDKNTQKGSSGQNEVERKSYHSTKVLQHPQSILDDEMPKADASSCFGFSPSIFQVNSSPQM